ncbi:MAG: GNAT family N-acetyltransferase [Chloroflexota bacterium]|nr:GNAT family N-acetyltransferase [Chloroflexota bacterium]
MRVPTLETDRLSIREFVLDDLKAVRLLLDGLRDSAGAVSDERARWLNWTISSYQELARLHQPPYGDRAIVVRQTGGLIGVCGYVPLLGPFRQIPGLADRDDGGASTRNSPEVGLYWEVLPDQRRRGYATEAAEALVRYAFGRLNLRRLVATTTYDNLASIAVMRKLGMRIERNPFADPRWLQIVGILAATQADAPEAGR